MSAYVSCNANIIFLQILISTAVVYYSTVCCKTSTSNLYQEQLERDARICRL